MRATLAQIKEVTIINAHKYVYYYNIIVVPLIGFLDFVCLALGLTAKIKNEVLIMFHGYAID